MAAPFEWAILNGIQALRTPFGDWLMTFLSSLGNAGWIWIALAGVLLVIPKTRRVGCVLALALIIDLVITDLVIKNIVARPRPFTQNPEAVELLVNPPWGYSFPSGHTAAAFASVSALFFSRSRIWIPAAVLASLIAFSRLYLYVHFPLDVVGGLAIGLVIGYVAFRIINRVWPDSDTPSHAV